MFRRIHYNSPVILTYALISFAVLLLGYATGGRVIQLLFCVYRSRWSDPLHYFRLFGHALGHANLEHFFGNFLIILLIGPSLEEKYGSVRLLIVMLAAALITGLFHVIFSANALLGASGVAFAFIILGSFASLQKGRLPLTVVMVAILYLGREVFEGMYNEGNVSHITHVLGGICGGVLGFFLNTDKRVKTDI